MIISQHGSMYAKISPWWCQIHTLWCFHGNMIQLYIPTTFSGCERFFSTAVPSLSSILHVYTPSSSESTLHSWYVKTVSEHVVRETTTTPLWSHFREETGVELEKEEIMRSEHALVWHQGQRKLNHAGWIDPDTHADQLRVSFLKTPIIPSCKKKYHTLPGYATSMFTFQSMGAWERG